MSRIVSFAVFFRGWDFPRKPPSSTDWRSWKLDRQANQAWTKQFSKEGIAFLNESLKPYMDFTMDLQRRAM